MHCAAHIVDNCLQHAVDTLHVHIESFTVKIFHIYIIRVTFESLQKLNISHLATLQYKMSLFATSFAKNS